MIPIPRIGPETEAWSKVMTNEVGAIERMRDLAIVNVIGRKAHLFDDDLSAAWFFLAVDDFYAIFEALENAKERAAHAAHIAKRILRMRQVYAQYDNVNNLRLLNERFKLQHHITDLFRDLQEIVRPIRKTGE